MSQKRLASSTRSETSEMDLDGTGTFGVNAGLSDVTLPVLRSKLVCHISEAESEFVKLQRQLRVMERDRQAYSIQAREQIRKQQQEIDKLLKEQEELHRKLGACKRAWSQQRDSEATQSLQLLLQQLDLQKEEVDREKQSGKEIQKEIASMESKLAELRKEGVTTNSTDKFEVRQTKKAIRTLEGKLDRETTRLNEQMAKNKLVREELQTLHVERDRFQQLKNKLNKELQEVRKKIGETISLSTAAYDARVEAQSKMTMMREKAAKELAQYNAEMKELERVLVHEYNLKEFMTTKCSERSGNDNDAEMGAAQMSELKEQRRTDSGEESLDVLEEAFQRIQAVTGEDNLDLLVSRFIQGEDRNSALLKFVNEQNNEAEALRGQINQIEAEIKQIQVRGLQQEQDHRAKLRAIDQQRKETEAQTEDYENQAGVISNVLDEIKTGVNSILSVLQCDRSAIEDMLGSSTENNIMSYLGLVEQKTDELLTVQAFLSSKDLEKNYNPIDLPKFLLGQNPDVLQQKISTQPAANSVEYDAEDSPITDEDERPLSQGELRKKILKGVLLKGGSAQHSTKASKTIQQHILEDALI
ncbi:coiled-coil domain-containing protein 114 [Salarias fasciatus]|uniref:coiled-coil domain-containing protein 114 n=1 Tax=Salarias fasciatus TaxID=181472 RepID=UPI0011768723|nr:coiled-coil domain-containing protein 114-like [Salarias fasciatus]